MVNIPTVYHRRGLLFVIFVTSVFLQIIMLKRLIHLFCMEYLCWFVSQNSVPLIYILLTRAHYIFYGDIKHCNVKCSCILWCGVTESHLLFHTWYEYVLCFCCTCLLYGLLCKIRLYRLRLPHCFLTLTVFVLWQWSGDLTISTVEVLDGLLLYQIEFGMTQL